MANPIEDAKSEAEADVAASGERFDRLVESLGGSASASAVFGDPVERDGVTVVPVARVRYGVGGGGGRGAGRRKKRDTGSAEQEVGYGHGGGVQATPVGYIEISGGKADYKRIADPVRPLAALMLFPLVGVVCFALIAIISLQTAKSARKMLPAMPHVPLPSVRWND
jgi:uncharacterized spore protein YtfJ